MLRASYSRSYSAIPIYEGQWGTQGFNSYQTFLSPNVQLQPAVPLTAALPPPAHPLPDLRPDAANNTIADLIDATDREPVYQSASVTIERELPGSMVVSVGASYSGGRNLLVSNSAANPNAIAPAALVFGDQLYNLVFNQSLRPYPQYKGFDVYSSYPLGRYQRDAGFLRVEKRASNGAVAERLLRIFQADWTIIPGPTACRISSTGRMSGRSLPTISRSGCS